LVEWGASVEWVWGLMAMVDESSVLWGPSD